MKQELLHKIASPFGHGNTRAEPVADYLLELKFELSMLRSRSGRSKEDILELTEQIQAMREEFEEMQKVGIRRMDRFLELKTRVANMDQAPAKETIYPVPTGRCEPAVTPAPMLTPVAWAQLLIEQLPWKHDGRNNWLMSHGKGAYTNLLRKEWSEKNGRPWGKEMS